MVKLTPMGAENTATTTGAGRGASDLVAELREQRTKPLETLNDLFTTNLTPGAPALVPGSAVPRGVTTPQRFERTAAQRPSNDPMRVANDRAPTQYNGSAFTDFVGSNGRVNVSALLNDPEIRRLAGDGDMASLVKAGKNAWSRIPQSVRTAANLSQDERATLQRGGVSALSDAARTRIHDAFADQRVKELRAISGSSGIVEGGRVAQLFGWIDRFDSNGRSGSIALVEPTNPQRLTPSGRVLQRVLENASTQTSFTEREFVAGFRNGTIDAQALRNDPKARAALQQLGVLNMLEQATANGVGAQLTVPQLRALYRAIDRVDNNNSPDSVVVRTGGPQSRAGAFPFELRGIPPVVETQAGRGISALNSVFRSNHIYNENELRPTQFDPPPPSPLDSADPLAEEATRLGERRAVDRETFRGYMRDARVNLAAINAEDQAALARLGLPMETLRSIAAPDSTIGGPNAEMARLYELLRSKQTPPSQQLQVMSGANGLAPTPMGQALNIIERYTTRYQLTTQERMRQDMTGTRLDLSALDKPAPGVPGKTTRQALTELGFDAAALQTWAAGSPDRSSGAVASSQIFGLIRQMGNYGDPRPGTVSLGATTVGPAGSQVRTPSQAGRVIELLQSGGVLKTSDQQMRAYPTADGAMLAPAGTRRVQLQYDEHTYPGNCLLLAAKSAKSHNGRTYVTDGNAHWMVDGGNSYGQVYGSADKLARGRAYIDGMLDRGSKVIVGVARLETRRENANQNNDRTTDHWVALTGRGVDEQGRLYYSYFDNARSAGFVGRFYVDPATQLLYAPVNTPYTINSGGYQVTAVRLPADGRNGGARAEFAAITGEDPAGVSRGTAPRRTRPRQHNRTSGRRSNHRSGRRRA